MSDSFSYAHLLEELRRRSSRAHASLLAPASLPLRSWLEETLGGEAGSANSLLATPVFEHKFGYRRAPTTMAELEAAGVLTRRLVLAMDAPPKGFEAQAFRRGFRPYTHQVAAWKALKLPEPTSVVVSAGTGSGKTECFMVPVLDDLARQAEKAHGPLEGVQAILLYPLNALINSQRERLSAWTRGFGGQVRYCLYNGETKETERKDVQDSSPERVLSRKLLRDKPPPLLITNATMLEYMLIRPDDRPILAKSQGRLKYIIIDEAHTYVGSAAAELALLIRRVMNSFGVDPAQVRFVATSATLSSGDLSTAKVDIQRFLADVAGQPVDQVTVVMDEREIPSLPDSSPNIAWPNAKALEAATPEVRFELLNRSRGPRFIRDMLTRNGAQTLLELQAALAANQIAVEPADIVRVLDCAKDARLPAPDVGDAPDPFLPLRGHAFLRGLPGLWACLNPKCSGRSSSALDNPAWHFGRVFTSLHTRCSDCESQVLELALCQQCGSDYLAGRLAVGEDGFELLRPVPFDEITQPVEESADPEPIDDGEADATDEDENENGVSRAEIRLVSRRCSQELASALLTPEIAIDPATGTLEEGESWFSLVAPHRGDRFECPHCGHRDRSHEELFLRPCRTGRNFVLGIGVPVLLEHMREEGGTNDLPFGGRRTISFTDSRQGTARFAAKAQGEAERNYVRSFVYHHVLAAQSSSPGLADGLRAELAKLKAAQVALPDPLLLEGTILEKTTKLREVERGTRVPLEDVAIALSSAWNFNHLLRYWRDYLPFREAGITPSQLAKWMVLREFARRPIRRASLETLGLISVRFPNLDLTRDPPHLWQQWAGMHANDTWHSFLKLLLDFYVRSNSAVLLDRQFFRWVGTSILPKVVGGPGEKPVRNRRISWPEIGGRSRLAWLLVRAFKLDAKDAQTRADIDSVLVDAWEYVKPALQAAEGGRQLVMDKLELELVKNAWVCPLTRMLLDTTILGHTPYQPPLDQRFDSLARPVRMPVPPEAFANNLTSWFESDPIVDEARAAGAISEFTERVLTVSPYYQVAEHSAQLPGSTLQKTEDQFKKGYLNLLSCSTTMEMGVDIGGLTGVAMNNAPPSPANFLQRVGRAGRRGESAAVSLTVCRHLPHDQAVFDQPVWPFRTPMHITAVRLDSERIVERHVRAAALSRYLLTQAQPDTILRLECAWFFVAPEGSRESVCERLLAWFDSGARSDAELTTHLERITRTTALDGVRVESLLAAVAPAFQNAFEAFDAVRRSLHKQRDALPPEEREESPAAYAIRRQLARLEGEYLLSYLADQQVLPGYGFPTGVVPFVTTTVEELKAIKMADDRAKAKKTGDTPETREDRQERLDARTKLMGFPSRDLPMALREYAPGSKVVLERRTYTPRGVTLNWHLPPEAGEANVRNVQALRTAWCCPMCGMGGTTAADLPKGCPACSHTSLRRSGYLQPAGFAVDLYEDAEMDASPPVYIPVEEPWISSGMDRFETLGMPTLIRARHTPNGEIVHLSNGAHGHGYAVCLRCGRSEPEVEAKPERGEVELPTPMKDHKRLRGGKGSKWKEEKARVTCEGNETNWAIRRHLAFGGSQRTDVLELQFLNPATGRLVADRVFLTTLAVALRKEAARAIGIEDRELGYQVSPRIVDGQSGFAVLLYDTASGGAGFCAQLPPLLPALLRRAVETCRCPRTCSGACHSCLLSHDTQHDIRYIDRFALAPQTGEPAILNHAYLAALELSADDRVFGDETAFVWGEPHLAVVRQARRMAGPDRPIQVRLYATGDGEDSNPAQWAGRHLVRSLLDLGLVTVTLVLPEVSVPTDWQQARQLASLIENEGIQLHIIPSAPSSYGMQLWVELIGHHCAYGFAARGDDLSLGAGWCMKRAGSTHVEGPRSAQALSGNPRAPSALVREPLERVVVADLRPTAGGAAHKFGERFWAAIERAAPGQVPAGPIDRVTYQDRYLQAPGAVHGLFSVLEHLGRTGRIGGMTRIEVITQSSDSDRLPRSLRHNWPSADRQRAVIEGLLAALGSQLQVRVLAHHEKKSTPHYRSLELACGTEELEIRLDQGFGFLDAVPPGDRFPFEADTNEQVSKLLAGAWMWQAPTLKVDIPAYILKEK